MANYSYVVNGGAKRGVTKRQEKFIKSENRARNKRARTARRIQRRSES